MSASPAHNLSDPETNPARIAVARVAHNTELCREHARLTLAVDAFAPARPGQFVQISPAYDPTNRADGWGASHGPVTPLLPRAFSIGGLRRAGTASEIDVIYRVVGVGTRWMRALSPGDRVNVLGPLGREFPIDASRSKALLVIGGVGLPPLLWLAEALQQAGKRTIAFLGAQTADLVPLTIDAANAPATDASRAVRCAAEFACYGADAVISTDDGSLGFHGNVVAALDAYSRAQTPDANDTVVYTCGPERMMRAAADWCQNAGIACIVCMERPMACGMGTCQSCIVTVHRDAPESGTRYALCCTEGPVFAAEHIVWDDPALLKRQSQPATH
ncbi:MAG: dihydroorotate dehydrogenase electron transfer subunit [Phycisphaerales bacterium]|nr:dihydroorotate dehydrogenase electron transfer subunit [Phycisphaerales bacterium]